MTEIPETSAMPVEKSSVVSEDGSVTAADFLESQAKLEKEAREAMPYEPDTCTYPQALRQLVFACLTCRRANKGADIGVCYSCSIQCHSTHELVELFSKRDFVCDCGTSKMAAGKACAIRARQKTTSSGISAPQAPRMRSGSVSVSSATSSRPFSSFKLPPATDIESSGNVYNHNFSGHFCGCDVLYNPLKETQTMHQCYLGDACGEDWFHQECILGYLPGLFQKELFVGSGENKLDELPPPGVDAASETVEKMAEAISPQSDADTAVPHFPELSSFGEFICWKCVDKHKPAFDELVKFTDIVAANKPHFTDVKSVAQWDSLYETQRSSNENEPPLKKQKTESGAVGSSIEYSVFLFENFHTRLCELQSELRPASPLRELLNQFEFLVKEDPIYQPVEEDVVSTQASEGSLYDLGSTALSSLPIPQALEGLQAYDTMKEKLRGFFKEFVDQKKVVTEEEVRDFFGKMKQE